MHTQLDTIISIILPSSSFESFYSLGGCLKLVLFQAEKALHGNSVYSHIGILI